MMMRLMKRMKKIMTMAMPNSRVAQKQREENRRPLAVGTKLLRKAAIPHENMQEIPIAQKDGIPSQLSENMVEYV